MTVFPSEADMLDGDGNPRDLDDIDGNGLTHLQWMANVGAILNATTVFAPYSFLVDSPSIYGAFTSKDGLTQQLNGESFSGSAIDIITIPVTAYDVGAIVNNVGANIEDIPDSTDGFDITMDILVASPDGTNRISVIGQTIVPAHENSGAFDPTTLSLDSVIGSDLSFDGTHVLTAAGGQYGVMVRVAFGWD